MAGTFSGRPGLFLLPRQTALRRIPAGEDIPAIICCHHLPTLDAVDWLTLLAPTLNGSRSFVTVLDHDPMLSMALRFHQLGASDHMAWPKRPSELKALLANITVSLSGRYPRHP